MADKPQELNQSQFAELPFKRVSLLTGLVNGANVLVLLFAFIIFKNADLLKEIYSHQGELHKFLSGHLWPLIFSVVILLLLIIGTMLWEWYWTGYYLDETHLFYKHGGIFKVRRQVPLNRVQAVDQQQTLLARFLGLYKVHVESAGGSDSHVDIGFVNKTEAEWLTVEISRRMHETKDTNLYSQGIREPKPSASTDIVLDAPESNNSPLVRVSNRNLILAHLLDFNRLVGLVVLIVWFGGYCTYILFTVGFSVDIIFNSWSFPTIVAAIGFVSSFISPLFRNYNTQVWQAERGLKSTRGLTTVTRSYLPFDRVHALIFKQSLIWRVPSWWQARAVVAGRESSTDEDKNTNDQIIPVGTEQNIRQLLDIAMLDLGQVEKEVLLNEAIHGNANTPGWLGIAPRARWLSPIDGSVEGLRVTDTAIVRRWGFFDTRIAILPLTHAQYVEMKAGPLARALGVATLSIHLVRNNYLHTLRMSLIKREVAEEVAKELNQRILQQMKPLTSLTHKNASQLHNRIDLSQ